MLGAVNTTTNADRDKYVYNGHSIGFDSRAEFSSADGSVGKNVVIFGTNMSSSVHIDNKKKRYFNFWHRPNTSIEWY